MPLKLRLLIFALSFLYKLDAQIKDSLSPNVFIYNNQTDTIVFKKLNGRGFCLNNSTAIIDSIQIDGHGRKEVIFYRSSFCQVSEHGGTFDIDESSAVSKYEIWDLDRKILLFEVTTAYSNTFNRFEAYASPPYLNGKESFKCSFSIDNSGDITITNIEEKYDVKETKWREVKRKEKSETIVEEIPFPQTSSKFPSIKEGIYRFKDGKYQYFQL